VPGLLAFDLTKAGPTSIDVVCIFTRWITEREQARGGIGDNELE